MTEKERLLAVASPEEWDCWLTSQADIRAPKSKDESDLCLFCKAFGDNPSVEKGSSCYKCMPLDCNGFSWPCNKYLDAERIDAAITRLERAGIWEEEDEKIS